MPGASSLARASGITHNEVFDGRERVERLRGRRVSISGEALLTASLITLAPFYQNEEGPH